MLLYQRIQCGASAYGPGGHFARDCPNAPNSSGMMSGSNAAPVATTPAIAALGDAGTHGYASGASKQALVNKAMESARLDFKEHVTRDGS